MAEIVQREPVNLIQFMGAEEQQVLASLSLMKNEGAAIKRVEGLYHAAMSYGSTSEDDMVIFQFLTFTHYHLLFALACHMRCHMSEAFASVRAAIDATLNAAYIIKDRAAQAAYVRREHPFGGAMTKHLYKMLKEGKELPHPLMAQLLKQQSTISQFAVHADVGTFLHRTGRVTEGGVEMFAFQYFQFSRDPNERALHAINIVHSFVMILDVFSDFLIDEQKVVQRDWRESLHRLGGQLEQHAAQLREAIRRTAGEDGASMGSSV